MEASVCTWMARSRKVGDLCQMECSSNAQQRSQPTRTVVQYIKGKMHAWEEHDLDGKNCMCIVQTQPARGILESAEAARLLEESANWGQPDSQGNQQQLPHGLADRMDAFFSTWPNSNSSAYQDHLLQSQLRTHHTEAVNLSALATSGQPVADTLSFPWYNAGRLVASFQDSTQWCTLFLVSPYLALTNAHCVFTKEGEQASAIFAAPAQYVSEGVVVHPYGTVGACNFAWPDLYDPTTDDPDNFAFDYAAVFLSPGQTSSALEAMTFMPIEFNPQLATGTTTNMIGYESEQMMAYSGSTTSFTFNSELTAGGRILYFAMPAGAGSSGGPIWLLSSESRRAIALNSGVMTITAVQSDGSTLEYMREVGTRFVPQNQDLIMDWLNSAANHQLC